MPDPLRPTYFHQPLDQIDPLDAAAYSYDLPEALVATHPTAERAGARMMIVDRAGGQITHARVRDLASHLRPHDRLVFNDTRVLAARIMARKNTGGRVELLALSRRDAPGWADAASGGRVVITCMTRSSKALRTGQQLAPEADEGAQIEVLEATPGRAVVSCTWRGSAAAMLDAWGDLPLPPYILRQRAREGRPGTSEQDTARYQTVFASEPGAIAAPTAGLHFDEGLLGEVRDRGVSISRVTLHVGAGTFKPIDEARITDHAMHSERYVVSEGLGEEIDETKREGGRVIAVGTTSARVLESEWRRAPEQRFERGARETTLFLYPGHGVQVCDGLLTNFHLPGSTLLTLVASVTGYELMRRAYDEAIDQGYRFYSYGDAMLIV